jgi:phosphoserine phosphatase
MNLVLQGPGLSWAQAEEAGAMVGAKSIKELHPRGFRICGGKPAGRLPAWCEERRIDNAWIGEGRRFADLKLLAMDMDSTLITIECIDELGAYAGKKAEIAAITEAAMRGEIKDYKESLKRRVALLAGQPASILGDLYEKKVELTPGAEALIAACKKHGVRLLLVSGGFGSVAGRLKDRLGLDHVLSNTLEVENECLTGRLVGDIVDADAKAGMFRKIAGQAGAAKEQTVAIGDGANDLKMMAEAGLSVAFHAKPVVRAQASCALTWSGLDAVIHLFE